MNAPIISVCGQKGGVGKSTTTLNLATLFAQDGKRVLIVDADSQASCMAWRAERQAEDISALSITTAALMAELKRMRVAFDIVLVDVGGRGLDSAVIRQAIVAADLVIMPSKASQLDLWSLADTVNLLTEARALSGKEIRAGILLNMVPPSPNSRFHNEAAEAIKGAWGEAVFLFDAFLTERAAFKRGIDTGKSTIDQGDSRATSELLGLYEEVKGHMNRGVVA